MLVVQTTTEQTIVYVQHSGQLDLNHSYVLKVKIFKEKCGAQ